MPKGRSLFALLLVALMALAPSLAEARAGGSYRMGGGGSFMSQGSRGSHTYDTPMERSLTPQPGPAGNGLAPGMGGYASSHPFLTGLAGGLFGGWLGSLLFPHWGMGYGMGFGSALGSILIWMLLAWGLWMGLRAMSGGVMARTAYGGASLAGGGMMGGFGVPYGRPPARGAPLAIAHDDYVAFETILKHVQGAWSTGDINALRLYVTPEMLSYFAEELAENQSQGVINHVEDVELARGDLREAWDEGRLHYATCYLQWRARDFTVRADRRPGDPDAVVSGDPQQPSLAAELWTFARSPGGHWLLSAIQQV